MLTGTRRASVRPEEPRTINRSGNASSKRPPGTRNAIPAPEAGPRSAIPSRSQTTPSSSARVADVAQYGPAPRHQPGLQQGRGQEEPGRGRQSVGGQHVVVPLTAAGQEIHPRHHGEALRHSQDEVAQRANRCARLQDRAHRQADHNVRQAGKHEQEHAGEGAVVPIHPEEIEWMSELPMKNATVNDRNSTPTSTAILLLATGRSRARAGTPGAVVMGLIPSKNARSW